MSLSSVKMSEEVWLTCVTHALSTETEEIMGLLLGDIQESGNGSFTALIWGASPQTRSDRRKDRVETNPEQLAAASAQAEHIMTALTGKTTRVIGWYHSHPHITVLPSHVDVRTQAMYQLLDPGFIGLIFSCFSEDVTMVGRIQVIAFQSSNGKQHHAPVPIPRNPAHISSPINLDVSTSARIAGTDQDKGDSETLSAAVKGGATPGDLGGFFASADANYLGKANSGGNHQPYYVGNSLVDVDPMDISESMQEAMHRSNLDMSGAEHVRKEIPLLVTPASSLLKLDSPLTSFTDLQRVLYEEERGAYNLAISQNARDKKVHPLAFIHHTSTYQASLCKLMEYCLSPAISALQDRLRENEIRLGSLIEEAKLLEGEASLITRESISAVSSPRNITSSRGGQGIGSTGDRELHSSPESNSSSLSSSGSRSRKGF